MNSYKTFPSCIVRNVIERRQYLHDKLCFQITGEKRHRAKLKLSLLIDVDIAYRNNNITRNNNETRLFVSFQLARFKKRSSAMEKKKKRPRESIARKQRME